MNKERESKSICRYLLIEPHGMYVLEIPNENGKRTLLLLLLLLSSSSSSSSSPYYFKFKAHPTFKKGSSLLIKFTTLLVRPVL
jgi:hypothetical protein